MRNVAKDKALLALLLLLPGMVAADDALVGDWMLELTGKGPRLVGQLTLARDGNAWVAHVEGGPADVRIDGDDIELRIDSRDLAGFVFHRRLTGHYADGRLTGTFMIEGATEDPEPGGAWTAVRKPAPRPRQPSEPVDISGIWTPAPGIDFRKYTMDLTDSAQAWFEGYLMHYDQPNVRCVSPGIVAMVAWGAYPFEILADDGRMTFIYEVESEVRRIFLDGREPPDFYPTSPMGYSTGYWDGSDLVIETQLLEANVRDFRGEPVSDGARMHERYSLSDDGQRLSAVITLLDPENYKVPPIRRREWVRNPETVILPYECDPDSFYRQMYDEGKLDMYFERSRRRLME